MLTSLAAHVLLLARKQKEEEKEVSYWPITANLFAILFYLYAHKYYQLCHSIDITPLLP